MKQLFAVAFAFGLSMSAMADHGHGGMGGGHGHGGHGHGGHGGHGPKVTCTARNLRGAVFTARGSAFRRFEVQQRAVNKCVSAGSAVCRATGCY